MKPHAGKRVASSCEPGGFSWLGCSVRVPSASRGRNKMWRSTPMLGVEHRRFAPVAAMHAGMDAGACRSSVGSPSQCIFSVVNTTTGGIASLLSLSRIFLVPLAAAAVRPFRSVGRSVDRWCKCVCWVGTVADGVGGRRGGAWVSPCAIVHSLS